MTSEFRDLRHAAAVAFIFALVVALTSCSRTHANIQSEDVADHENLDATYDLRPSSLCISPDYSFDGLTFSVLDSLYHIVYDSLGRPVAANSKTRAGMGYRLEFKYDEANNLVQLRTVNASSGLTQYYTDLVYSDGSTNSIAANIRLTTFTREGSTYKQTQVVDQFYNASAQMFRQVNYETYGNYHLNFEYDKRGNLRSVTSGEGKVAVHNFVTYDNRPNIFGSNRVWQILSGNYSVNNPLQLSTTWRERLGPYHRLDITFNYLLNEFGQIDRVDPIYTYFQEDGTTKIVKAKRKQLCEMKPNEGKGSIAIR